MGKNLLKTHLDCICKEYLSALIPWLLGKAAEEASCEATFALDFSDTSKEFGGEGMEGMAPGCAGVRAS